MVFTIPEDLRRVLDENRSLLKVLMDAVSRTMRQMVEGRRKAVPGIVCILHLYGRDLQLNPHIHVLFTEGGLTKSGEWVPVTFLEYGKLRKIWQYHLLTALKGQMPKTKETSRLIDSLFRKHLKGFYIYAKRRVTKARNTTRYIGRYIRHPAIAESRITKFNPEANTVTFWYQRDGAVETVAISALEFIDRLVKLIPDRNMKLIRYYGLYARRTRSRIQKILTSLSREKPKPQPRKEPVKCPKCGATMELIAITKPS
jgi:adenylate kinase family enzyme